MSEQTRGPALLAAIHDRLARLPSAQARVAQFLLDRPEEALRLSVAELAAEAGSGEASVIRLCRALGYACLRDLRVALATNIAYRQSGGAADAGADPAARLAAALRATVDNLGEGALRRVARVLAAAPHVDIFGSGVSGMGAHLFAARFSRIGLVARAWSDEVAADESQPSRRPGSVAMIVSETGLTLRTSRFLTAARAGGAITVAICGQAAAALRPLCDEVLTVAPLTPLPERGELAPLIAKLFLCDLLAAEVLALG